MEPRENKLPLSRTHVCSVPACKQRVSSVTLGSSNVSLGSPHRKCQDSLQGAHLWWTHRDTRGLHCLSRSGSVQCSHLPWRSRAGRREKRTGTKCPVPLLEGRTQPVPPGIRALFTRLQPQSPLKLHPRSPTAPGLQTEQ